MSDQVPQVLFIGGMSRSGSTIIESSLESAVGGAFGLGEVRHLWGRGLSAGERCACGQDVPRCPFWAGVVDELGVSEVGAAHVEKMRRDADRYRAVAWRRDRTVPYDQWLATLYRVIQDRSGASVLLDSSKSVGHLAALWRLEGRQEIRLRFLHLVRDPRGVAFSMGNPKGRPDANGTMMFSSSPTRTASDWLVVEAALGMMKRRLRGEILQATLRYEDWAQLPREQEDLVLAALGLSNRQSRGQYERHGLAGNPIRFDASQTPVAADNRWRTGLDRRQRFGVVMVAWPGMLGHRYRLRS